MQRRMGAPNRTRDRAKVAGHSDAVRYVPHMRNRFLIAGLAATAMSAAASAAPSGFEAAVFKDLNHFRDDPAAYADDLTGYRDRFDGKLLIAEEGEDIDIMTNEGVAAVNEAIRALRSEAPRPSFVWSDMLQRAAADHVAVQSRSGAVGHYSNNSDPGVRMRARGGGPYVSEVITYGHQTPPGVIHQLLIDDGVPGRGHRFSLLRSDLRYAGVACGSHPHYRLMCVILMSPTRDGTAPPPPQRSAP